MKDLVDVLKELKQVFIEIRDILDELLKLLKRRT